MEALFTILTVSGNFFNDILALISAVGIFTILLGSIPGLSLRKLAAIGEWSISAVFFGILFQTAIIATGMNPEKIGFVLPMHPALVTGLFAVSSLFLLCYWRLKRT